MLKWILVIFILLTTVSIAEAFSADEGVRLGVNTIAFQHNISSENESASGGATYIVGQFDSSEPGRLWQRLVHLAAGLVISEEDTTPPTFTLISPEAITYFSGTDIPIRFSTDGTEQTIWYNIDGNTNTTITGNTTFDTDEGEHNFNFYINDSSGNEDSETVLFSVELEGGVGGGSGGATTVNVTNVTVPPEVIIEEVIEEKALSKIIPKETFDKVRDVIIELRILWIGLAIALGITSIPKKGKKKFDKAIYLAVGMLFVVFVDEIFEFLGKIKIINKISPLLEKIFLLFGEQTGASNPLFFGALIVLLLVCFAYLLFYKKDVMNVKKKPLSESKQ